MKASCASLLALSLSAPAAAQVEGDTPPEAEKAPLETTPEAPAAPAADESEKRGKAAFPRIADDEETIYAVQRKAYLVKNKFELTPMGAVSFTDRFVVNGGWAASVSYHLAENFGVEMYGAQLFPNESGLTDEILERGRLTPEIAKLTQMRWGWGVGVQWSPIYGKIEIFDISLGNLGFYLAAGIGAGQSRVQCTLTTPLDPNVFGESRNTPGMPRLCGERDDGTLPMPMTGDREDAFRIFYEPNRTHFMATIGGGVRFYFSNLIGLKLEVKDWLFPARVFRPGSNEPTQRYTDAIRSNIFVQAGASFLFGGEEN